MYCVYVGFDYTYIDINALAQGIKSVLASQVWFQAVCMYVCMYVLMYDYIYVLCVCRVWLYIHRCKRTGTGD